MGCEFIGYAFANFAPFAVINKLGLVVFQEAHVRIERSKDELVVVACATFERLQEFELE